MSRKHTITRTREQPTISKFFTSTAKEKQQNGALKCMQVATDVSDEFQVLKKPTKKSCSTSLKSGDDAPKNKRLHAEKETVHLNHSDVNIFEDTQQTKPSNHISVASCHLATSSKLKDFEYGESNVPQKERSLFKPKCQTPEIFTCTDDIQLMDQDFSDTDDPVSPAYSQKNETSFPSSSTSSLSSASMYRRAATAGQTHVDTSRKAGKYTPLEQQFVDIKAQYPDAVLFVECGYKYRFFGEDAEIAARVLKIYCHVDHNFMTASIPVHRLFVHVRRIVAAGYKVGIVKQTETSHLKAAGNNKSGPFARQLTALYTKSTLIGEDPTNNSEADYETSWQSNNYLMCVCEQQMGSSSSHRIGLVCVDPSTGEILYDEFADSTTYAELDTRIAHLQPVELVMPSDTSQHLTSIIKGIAALSETKEDRVRLEVIDSDVFNLTKAVATVSQFYSNDQSKLQDVLNLPKLVISCLAALLEYLKSFHLERILTVTSNLCRFSDRSGYMYMNSKSLCNLEVFCNSYDGSEKGSLYWVLNNTCTKFGARLLRKWLAQPLLDVGEIQARLDAVQELVDGNFDGLTSLQQIMSKLPDLERGLCSIFHKKCSLTEFCNTIKALEKVRKELCDIHIPVTSFLLQTLLSSIPEYLEDITGYFSQINEKSARENDKANLFVDVSKFPVIRDRKEEIRKVENLIQNHLREIRLILKQPCLKYITVMQTEFLIEVKNNQIKEVPADWTLISSTKTVSRFHSPYVAEHYHKLNELREQLLLDVNITWQEFLDQFSAQFTRYQRAVTSLAALDCLMSLAKTASQGSFCRPQIHDKGAYIEIQQGRHPIIDVLSHGQEQFVPNDTFLDADGQRVMIISGPNMGGKSSYIRQVALISIMAQIGSFVPAQATSLGVIDAIYTRMGASDEIFQGRSTFMVELQEAAEIMVQATDRSLVILDELGRGTSTYDGVAIAHATLEYFIQKRKCLVLFVTHFPMMSDFHQVYPNQVKNFHMTYILSEEDKDNIPSGVEPVTFLYQLSEGAAEESYGLNVARLADIPDTILNTAAKKSRELGKSASKKVFNNQMFASLYRVTEEDVKLVLQKCVQPNQTL